MKPGGGGGAPAHHVLIGPADVGGENLQDRPVPKLPAVLLLQHQFRVVQVLDRDAARSLVDDASVGVRHRWFSKRSELVGARSGWQDTPLRGVLVSEFYACGNEA